MEVHGHHVNAGLGPLCGPAERSCGAAGPWQGPELGALSDPSLAALLCHSAGAASQAETPTPVELTAVLMPVEAAESSVVVGLPSAVDVCRTGSALCIHVDAACLAQTSPAGLVQKTASDAIRCNQHMWSSCALVQQALWHL